MTKQATHSNAHPIMGEVIDLDAKIAEREIKPARVKLGGKYYTVRRDLTAKEVAEVWRLINAGQDVDALAMISTAPVMLNKALEKLAHEHYLMAVQDILTAAGVARRPVVEPGE